MGDISAASQEQMIGIEKINKGLVHVKIVVQQNSSISEETASASDELNAQTDQMLSQMSRFIAPGSEGSNAEFASTGKNPVSYDTGPILVEAEPNPTKRFEIDPLCRGEYGCLCLGSPMRALTMGYNAVCVRVLNPSLSAVDTVS